jgi:hypothetical protein
MDLKQRLDIIKTNEVALEYPQGGFGGMTNRVGKKPIIIACNGHAHGMPPVQSRIEVGKYANVILGGGFSTQT